MFFSARISFSVHEYVSVRNYVFQCTNIFSPCFQCTNVFFSAQMFFSARIYFPVHNYVTGYGGGQVTIVFPRLTGSGYGP